MIAISLTCRLICTSCNIRTFPARTYSVALRTASLTASTSIPSTCTLLNRTSHNAEGYCEHTLLNDCNRSSQYSSIYDTIALPYTVYILINEIAVG